MGWVETGALIAIVCYALYRYPQYVNTATTSKSESQRTDDSTAQSGNNRTTSSIEKVRTADDGTGNNSESALEVRSSSTGIHNKTVMQEGKTEEEEEEEDDEDKEKRNNDDEGQATPKASATAVPMLQVPELLLDNDDANSGVEKQSKQHEQEKQPRPIEPSRSQQQQQQRSTDPSTLMPPPKLPASQMQSTSQQQQRRPPTLNTIKTIKTNNNPVPNRGPPQNPNMISSPSRLQPPPSAASSLRAPQNNNNRRSNSSSSSMLSPTPAGSTAKPAKRSGRVKLQPGYSPLDWAALTANPNNKLRGANLPPHLIRVTPSMLKMHNGRKGHDAWTSYQGKVYNITPYLLFHPGGDIELMRGAGRDSGKLFSDVHPWVNWDAMLGECLVGILVPEHEGQLGQGESNNVLDEMD